MVQPGQPQGSGVDATSFLRVRICVHMLRVGVGRGHAGDELVGDRLPGLAEEKVSTHYICVCVCVEQL